MPDPLPLDRMTLETLLRVHYNCAAPSVARCCHGSGCDQKPEHSGILSHTTIPQTLSVHSGDHADDADNQRKPDSIARVHPEAAGFDAPRGPAAPRMQ